MKNTSTCIILSPLLVPPENIDPQTPLKSWTLNPVHLTSRKVKCFLPLKTSITLVMKWSYRFTKLLTTPKSFTR